MHRFIGEFAAGRAHTIVQWLACGASDLIVLQASRAASRWRVDRVINSAASGVPSCPALRSFAKRQAKGPAPEGLAEGDVGRPPSPVPADCRDRCACRRASFGPLSAGRLERRAHALEERGLSFNFGYGSQIAHNFSGGTGRLTRHADQWLFQATADTGKLWGWKGGTLQATITERNGRNLGADANIGTSMLLQEIYGRGQTWHLTQFWLNQELLDGRLQVKLGRLTVGEDFASFSCDFQNLTFCGSQPGNLVGGYWINWPTSQWAGAHQVPGNEAGLRADRLAKAAGASCGRLWPMPPLTSRCS
jgi:hypothetical protein